MRVHTHLCPRRSRPPPPPISEDDVPWRIQGAVYGIGLFSTSIFHIGAVIVPLYAATMTSSPLMFGLVFSAAHFLPLFLSIHTGALMDRLGARRVMLVCTAGRRDRAAALSGVPVDLGAGVPPDVVRPVGIHGLARRPDHDRPVHVRQDASMPAA